MKLDRDMELAFMLDGAFQSINSLSSDIINTAEKLSKIKNHVSETYLKSDIKDLNNLIKRIESYTEGLKSCKEVLEMYRDKDIEEKAAEKDSEIDKMVELLGT
jgi:flagellar hook-associated protein FlgK